MPFQFLDHIRQKAGARAGARISRWAFHSAFYRWSLRGDVPDRLIVRPVDPWSGCAEAGLRLFDGVFRMGCKDSYYEMALDGASWEPQGADMRWISYIHGFTWMRDLRACSNQGVAQGTGYGYSRAACQDFARQMLLAWMDRYGVWSENVWRSDILGERLAIWISLYEFFANDSVHGHEDDAFQEAFFDCLAQQARHLSRAMIGGAGDCAGVSRFKAAKGLLYAGLAIEGQEAWIEQALNVLLDCIDAQVLGDGAHISRNAEDLMVALEVLLDVRSALNAGGYPLPEDVQHAIDRMGPALRFYRYNDKGFALFQGVQKGDAGRVDAVLAQTGARGKVLQGLPCAKFERLSAGRSLVMIDAGEPALGFDHAHSSPLSFEMCYAKERLFVNCGSHPAQADWREAMRGSAAHNMLVVDHRDAFDLSAVSRGDMDITYSREDTKAGHRFIGEHHGYVPTNGLVHKRKLDLSANGHELRGQDILETEIRPLKVIDTCIRFHLHPNVKVSLVHEGQEALLRLSNGIGWRFTHDGGRLALEDSLFLGTSNMRKTKQLVIYGQVLDIFSSFDWCLKKEG